MKMGRKRTRVLKLLSTLLVVFALIAAGCGNSNKEEKKSNNAASENKELKAELGKEIKSGNYGITIKSLKEVKGEFKDNDKYRPIIIEASIKNFDDKEVDIYPTFLIKNKTGNEFTQTNGKMASYLESDADKVFDEGKLKKDESVDGKSLILVDKSSELKDAKILVKPGTFDEKNIELTINFDKLEEVQAKPAKK